MKIIGITNNYPTKSGIKEENPRFFLKPDTTLLIKNRPFFYPEFSNDIRFEVALVVKIDRNGKHIEPRFAHKYYNEIAVGIDFTAFDKLTTCQKEGWPYEIAKIFDYSTPISTFKPVSPAQLSHGISFSLHKNGQPQQVGNSKDMLFSIDELISYLSQFMTLKMGDILFTGSPSGMGNVAIGDQLDCFLEEEHLLRTVIK